MTKYHYTYRITNKVEQKHYYGVRSSKTHPSQDLGIKYFSSSTNKKFLAEQISNPGNFKYKVIKVFETREYAVALEIKLHVKFNVGVNESFYNKAKQTSTRFDTSGVSFNHGKNIGFVTVKDKDNISRRITREEFINDSSFISVNTGKMPVKDKDGNTFQVSKYDERYLSGELTHTSKGKTAVKDKDGNTLQVYLDDERFLNGELCGVAKGKIPVKDKDGNTFHVSADDERYISGELAHITKGKIVVRDKDGNTYSVTRDDKRFLSGELIINTKGRKWVHNDILCKNYMIYTETYVLKENEEYGHRIYRKD